MDKLIEALTIFKKYANEFQLKFPTRCEHDVMYVPIEAELVSPEDIKRLAELGFDVSEETDGFRSYDFGSC